MSNYLYYIIYIHTYSVAINGCLPYANNQGLEQSFPCRTSSRMTNGKSHLNLALSGQSSQEKAALL
jgi:hypothetical protein